MVTELLAQKPVAKKKKSYFQPAVSPACSEESLFMNYKMFSWSKECVKIKYLNSPASKKKNAGMQLLNTVSLVKDVKLFEKCGL